MASFYQIFNDNRLYGHCLTSLPNKIWDVFTAGNLIFYQTPDSGTARREHCVFEHYGRVIERWPNGNIKKEEFATNFLPAKYMELSFRWITGSAFTACLYTTAAPLGFAIKLIYILGLQLTNSWKEFDQTA